MIGHRIKQRRQSLKWTQDELADRAGIAQKNVSRYERNQAEPGAYSIIKLAEALEVSADYLLGLTDDPTPIDRAGQGLTDTEQALLAAARRGDDIGAIRLIVNKSL